MISVFEGILSKFLSIDDGIVICVNEEHPLKAESPIEVTEEGISICFNDEHPEKAYFPILVTEKGIMIRANEEYNDSFLYNFN